MFECRSEGFDVLTKAAIKSDGQFRKSVPVVAPGEVAPSFYLREALLPSEELTMGNFALGCFIRAKWMNR